MNRTKWEHATQEFNLDDDKTLFDSQFGDIHSVDIVGILLDFLGNAPPPNNHQAQISHCISDITAICTDIAHQLNPTGNDLGVVALFNHLSHTTLFSTALDDLFADIAQANPQPLPTPAIRQRTLELLTLHLVMKHFASLFYQQDKPFYALCLANKSLEVLGGAKQLYGLSLDRVLKIGLLSDDDKQSIHKQIQQEQGRRHALNATEHQRQERKALGEKYLHIMKERKFTSYTKTAEHIFIHNNQENKSFDWILKALKASDKSRISD